jgi:osmotically-inducible protein OsmY
MRPFSKQAVATLLVSASLGVGCTNHQNDAAIAQDVRSKLAADPMVKGSAVSVTTTDGNGTLKGTVKDPATQLLPGAE